MRVWGCGFDALVFAANMYPYKSTAAAFSPPSPLTQVCKDAQLPIQSLAGIGKVGIPFQDSASLPGNPG